MNPRPNNAPKNERPVPVTIAPRPGQVARTEAEHAKREAEAKKDYKVESNVIHNGVPYRKGDTIALGETDAKELIEAKAIVTTDEFAQRESGHAKDVESDEDRIAREQREMEQKAAQDGATPHRSNTTERDPNEPATPAGNGDNL